MVEDIIELRGQLWGSYILFVKTFFPLITGRDFIISNPINRESHFYTIARELTLVSELQTLNLLINVPPGHGKSCMLAMFVAWTLSRYPDSQYLYISYGHELAAKHTEFIRRIVQCPYYRALFDVQIRGDIKARDYFMTTAGGSIKAFGSGGAIVGQDAGLPGLTRFSGAVIMDDLHKIDEVHSDTVRGRVIENYQQTITQRPRSPLVPFISIGQRAHQDDISAFQLSDRDERRYKSVILKALDDNNNALYPELNSVEQLLEKKDKNPYVYSSQYQQEPLPAGGAIFKPEYFRLLDEEPDIYTTFITCDTAETAKSYNDATVFSFWGIYKIKQPQEIIALHCLDCLETRVEPKDLEQEFWSFWHECMRHKVKPSIIFVEKKSTGVTLVSTLKSIQGLRVNAIDRSGASDNKTNRFLSIQHSIASGLVSFTRFARHVKMCVDHMSKITANNSHRHDDICDTFYDAIRVALLDKDPSLIGVQDNSTDDLLKEMAQDHRNLIGYQQASWRRTK